MKVSATQQGVVTVAQLVGEIDTFDTEGLQMGLDEIAGKAPKRVVLDFAGVTYIASHGLGMIIAFHRKIRQGGGRVVMVNVLPAVKMILESVRLTSLIPVMDSLEEALAQ